MLTEQWQRIEDLFHAALDVAPEERSAYLFRECGGDESLRREVESLINAFETDNSFIEEPALSLGMGVLCESMSGSLVGRSLGHYQIIRLLGEGGMGAVYLAEDRILERQVALKFIANSLIDNEWSKEQLLNEARAVAKLENPNICAVYGVEQVDGHHFIVMQYVDGETLKSVLGRGAIDTKRTLEWAEQLAAVLSAAHARGIIHRDIKPQNIMVTPEDQLKVLDFGLAKFTRQINDPADVETETGVIAGTVAYMSPEQKRGEELDGRTDIFSFGIVLGEMLGWPNLSKSETDEETIATINSLPVNKVNGANRPLRAGLERIVVRCLHKERELRYDSAEEFRNEIQGLRETLAWRESRFWKRLGVAHYTVAAT
jgi:serine/threonine protein kinase